VKEFGTRGKLVAVLFALTTMLGCGALDAGTPAAQSAAGLVATSTVVDFGNVPVGTTSVLTNTIANTSSSPIVLTRAQIAQSDFTITGQKLPVTLAPGQRVVFQIAYSPHGGGSSQSTVVLATNRNRLSSTFTLRGTAILPGRIRLTPASLSFGNVPVGKSQSQSATLSNPGKTAVTITRAAISGSGFTLTGLSLPLTLQGGQSAVVAVTFKPVAGGATNGAISVVGAVSMTAPSRPVLFSGQGTRTPVAFSPSMTTLSATVSGIGMGAGQLAVSPASLTLGSVRLGASQTQSAMLINSGTSDLTIRQATVTGRGFRMSGVSFPLTLAAGQRKSFTVTFTPQSAGRATGSIAVTSDDPNAVVSVTVSATATALGALSSNPSSLSFRNVEVGKAQTLSAALTNSGSSSVTVSQANVTGAGFTVSGLSLPVTLAAGQSAAFSVSFNAQSSGSASGALSFASDAANGVLAIPLSSSTTAAPVGVLSTSDSSLNFGSVKINATGTQPETLTNSGGADVTITQAKVSGTGFSTSGLNLPLTLSPGQSFTFGTTFTPASGGNFTGSISLVSDASDSTLTITLAGTASVSGQLAVSPAALSFGSVTVGQSKSLTASLTATGSSITVSNASMSTSEFTISGLSLPITLAAGQSASFTVSFKPQASGAASASATFASNASNPSAQQSLDGSGAAAPQHSVALSWDLGPSSVVGYNIYRGTTAGGPYSKINSMNADNSYTDSSVQSGQTYFYVTTAVDGSGRESANSNQTQAVIPTP
jgi:hypothetical protein